MPREQINFPEARKVRCGSKDASGTTETVELSTDPAVHVNWHAGGNESGHVQVALECDRTYLKGLLEDLPTDDRSCAYSPVLTRSDVNKLIRVLRRARDQAYGRDE